jgi:hypothetical protein
MWRWGVVGLALTALSGVAAADDLPLPPDVGTLPQPYQLQIGTQPVAAQGFETSWSLERLRAFYEQALPKRGWRITLMPWMAQVKEQQAEFQRRVEEHQEEIEQDPELKARLEDVDFSSAEEQMDALIYAVRGTEHLLLNMQPQESGKITLCFVNLVIAS